jgi:hypothetical protein
MSRLAIAAASATLLAAAEVTSAWIGWSTAWRQGARAGTPSATARPAAGSSMFVPSASRDLAANAPPTYYGWRYPYGFPFVNSRMITQKQVKGIGR